MTILLCFNVLDKWPWTDHIHINKIITTTTNNGKQMKNTNLSEKEGVEMGVGVTNHLIKYIHVF